MEYESLQHELALALMFGVILLVLKSVKILLALTVGWDLKHQNK